MMISETIGKSVQETMQLSVHEIQLWSAWFNKKNADSKKAMNKGRR
jgi:hypothetical protein|tara:strand:- start:127 stop:264 length:138 start_codon:yes stop_codon:yes gene_type:complete